MNVTDTICEMVHYWPTTVQTRLDALDRLFCVCGTRYYWHQGRLVYCGSRELMDPIERLRQRHADQEPSPWSAQDLAADIAEVEAIHANEDAIVAGSHGPSLADWHGFYPLSDGSNLCIVPDDVEPDWLEAALETCERIIEYARVRPVQARFGGGQSGESVSVRNAEAASRVREELMRRFGGGLAPRMDTAAAVRRG